LTSVFWKTVQCFRNRQESHRRRYLGFADGCGGSTETQWTLPTSHKSFWTGTFLSSCDNKEAV